MYQIVVTKIYPNKIAEVIGIGNTLQNLNLSKKIHLKIENQSHPRVLQTTINLITVTK